MITLAIESTAGIASVAVDRDGKKLAVLTLDSGNTHSTTLLPMVKSALDMLSLKVSDVDLFVLSAGPGSFTGVRIGCATVKGLAFPFGTPCIGVSSLEAMAWNMRGLRGILCPVLDARRNTVYGAFFESDGADPPKRLTEDCDFEASDLADRIREMSAPVYLAGDGASIVRREYGEGLPEVPYLIATQSASGVLDAGVHKFLAMSEEEKKDLSADTLVPIYLKKPQAEREREERLRAEKNGEMESQDEK